MKRLILALPFLALTACGSTQADRDAWRNTGINAALIAVDALKDFGVNPAGSSDKALRAANAACRLIEAGSPLIVVAINKRIAEQNAADPEGPQTEPVTEAEVAGLFADTCTVVAALLEPAAEPV